VLFQAQHLLTAMLFVLMYTMYIHVSVRSREGMSLTDSPCTLDSKAVS